VQQSFGRRFSKVPLCFAWIGAEEFHHLAACHMYEQARIFNSDALVSEEPTDFDYATSSKRFELKPEWDNLLLL